MLKAIIRRMLKHEKGASFVEFAIILPVLLALVVGIIEFGWIFNGYITLTGAAREGARLAVIGKSTGEVTTAVNNHTVTFRGGVNSVSVNPSNYLNSYPDKITVTVEGDLPLITGLFINSISLTGEATMRREFNP